MKPHDEAAKKKRGGRRTGAGRPRTATRPLNTVATDETRRRLAEIDDKPWRAIEIAAAYYLENKMYILNLRGSDDKITEEENKTIDMILEKLDISFDDMQDTRNVTGWESYSCVLNVQQVAHFERDFSTGYSSVATIWNESDDDGKSIAEYLKSIGKSEIVSAS